MIKLNKLTDYSIVILTYLAKVEKQFYSVAQIAEGTEIPVPTVAKLMQQLAQAEFVIPQRGTMGGYKAQDDIGKMTLGTVIKKLGVPTYITNCNSPASEVCQIKDSCTFAPLWDKIAKEIMEVLEKYTIQSFVAHEELHSFFNAPCCEKKHSCEHHD